MCAETRVQLAPTSCVRSSTRRRCHHPFPLLSVLPVPVREASDDDLELESESLLPSSDESDPSDFVSSESLPDVSDADSSDDSTILPVFFFFVLRSQK